MRETEKHSWLQILDPTHQQTLVRTGSFCMSAFGEISKAKSVLCLCPAHGFCTELELKHRPKMTQRLQKTTMIQNMKCKFSSLTIQIVILLYSNVFHRVHQNISTLDALQDLALSPFTQMTAYCSTLAWVWRYGLSETATKVSTRN